MKTLTTCALLALSILFTGCVSQAKGIKFRDDASLHSPDKEKAQVVVFRPSLIPTGEPTHIICDGKDVGEVFRVGYLAFEVEPKKHVLHSKTTGIDRRYELVAEKNNIYYFELDQDTYVFVQAWDLIPIDKEKVISKMGHVRNSKNEVP